LDGVFAAGGLADIDDDIRKITGETRRIYITWIGATVKRSFASKEEAASTPIRIGYKGFSVEVPPSLFSSLLRWIPVAAFGLLLCSRYFGIDIANGGAQGAGVGAHYHLSRSAKKTFIFWIPLFNSKYGKLTDSRTAEEIFHQRLTEMTGGWACWDGETKVGDNLVSVKIYHASVVEGHEDVSREDIKNLIGDYFAIPDSEVLEIDY